HGPNVFEEPAVLQFYLDGIRWALGDLEADATPIGAAAVSATPAAMQNAINLLLLVDPQKDAVKGQWTLTDEGVRLEKPELAGVLDLPYAPPEEYDFEIEFTPQSDGRNVNQFLVAAGRSFAWKLNLYGQQPPIHGLDLLDGKLAKNRDEAVAQKPLTLEPGQRYTSKVEVRRGSLRALVNGEEFMRWSGDFNRLSLEPIFKLHDDRHLGVGSVTRGVVFHHIEVREVTGKGTFTRGAPAVQSGSANLPPNVFLYYDFDQAEPNGTVKDKNGHGNDGKIVGARWTPAGRRGGAYEFGADRNYISVPKSASFHPAQLTVSAWIRTSRIDAVWRRIIDKQWDRGFAMSIGGLDRQSSRFQGKATLEINSHFFASDAPVADGQWHHVVGTFDGEQQKLYVDGRLQNGRANWHGEVAANPFDITIGANRSNPDAKLGEVGASFEGMLDEVMIFDRALSAEEIKSLFDSAGTAPAANLENRPDIAALRYGLYFHFDITTFTGYQDMSRVGKAPPSLFAPRALDVRQWVRVAREAGATFAVLTAKHEAGFCMWPAKNYDYHVGLCPVRTDIVGEFVAACKAEGIKPGVHYAVPDGHIEGQVKFRGPVEPAHFAIIKKHLTELTANYPDILIYILDCAHRLSPEQFREVSNLLKQSNPQRLILQTALNERRGRIPSIPGLQEHNAVSVNKNWFWSPNAELTPASSLYQDYLKSAEQKQPLLVNVGPDRDGRIPDEYVAVLTALKGMMGVSTGAAPSPSATSGSAPGQRLQWFGYSVCDKPSAIQEIAPYTNFILLRDWEKNTNADEMIGAARKAGLKVILKLPSKQTWAEMENTVRPFIAKHRDTIVAACWGVTYHFSDWTPETLAENSRRLKQACPQLQCWAEFVEEPKSKVDTLPIPPEVDVILVNFYFDTQPASLRRKANNTFAGWMSKANGRPVLLQWIGQNVPKTTPDTMRTCAEVVREFGCAGLCFHSYDDSISANGGRKSGIVSNPTLVNEIKAIAKESGFAK
ncbi:MAG: alpha-L-fucosidase, partial [Verrucomicrobia bacterium]|nr:alpha-L-fucosidase [Verrucomicrobiota bacterium]